MGDREPSDRRAPVDSADGVRVRESEVVTALEAALIEEHERLTALERRLSEQARELNLVREELAAWRRAAGAAEAPRPPAPPAAGSRLVELSGQGAPPGPGYWLRRCQGFRVEAPSGRLGEVEEVRFGRHHDRPDALLVAAVTGRHRRHSLLVPIEDVDEISAAEGRVTLSTDPAGWLHPEGHRASLVRPFRLLARKLGLST